MTTLLTARVVPLATWKNPGLAPKASTGTERVLLPPTLMTEAAESVSWACPVPPTVKPLPPILSALSVRLAPIVASALTLSVSVAAALPIAPVL